MLIDILLFVASLFVTLITSLFRLFNLAVPQQFIESAEFFVVKLSFISGILNVPDILAAVGWFLTFTTYWYSVKVILWVFSITPWFGKNVRSPKL